MIIKLFKEMKAYRDRERLYKKIIKAKELLDAMEASGRYTKAQIDIVSLWIAAACVEYAKMF